jgi:catecholate siderophore receptor
MIKLTPIAAAVLAALAAPIPAIAQYATAPAPRQAATPAPAAAQPTTLQDVIVNGTAQQDDFNIPTTSLTRLNGDLHDIPQSVTVVSKGLMQSQGATSLSDALRNVAGITLGAAEGGTIGNNINLNGFSARTDIYLDGFRDLGQYYRDTFDLEEIEVLMGPSSMLFGRGSTGGVINQVSKKPKLGDFTDVTGSVTTNGLVRSTLDKNVGLSDTSAFRLNAMAQGGDISTRDQSSVVDYGVAPSFKFGIGTPTEVTLSALLQHNRDSPDYGFEALNGYPTKVNRDNNYGFTDDQTVQDIAALNATVQHKFTPDITIRNQTQYNYVRTNARETSPQSLGTVSAAGFTPLVGGISNLPLSDLWVRQQSHDRVITDNSIFNQTELSTKFDTGPFSHKLLAGLELGHDEYNNQARYRNGTCNGVALNPAGGTSGYVACEPLVNPDTTTSPANALTRSGNYATGVANTTGVYFNDTIALTKQVKLVGGLRYDRFEASIHNTINSGNTTGSTALAGASQIVNFTSVRAGAIWQPTQAQSYYFSYGTSFNPSLEQLTGTTGQQSLAPETNKSYEVGGKWDLMNGDLSLNSALFQITKSNARSLIETGVYELDGTVRVNGVRAGATGRITSKWQVYGAYTYLDAQITHASSLDGTEGNTPANTPKNTFNFWTTYQFMPNWEVGGGAVYTSKRYAANTDLVQVGGYTRWDGTLAYKQPKYDVRLNVFNLFNKNYYDQLIPSDGGRAVPGSGRTAMVTVSYHM